ncbi:MAG: DUF6364 family protein [Pirellulales bacterium]
MTKLTLSADPEVIEHAKRLADEAGTSVSSLFERFIRVLARRRPKHQVGPLTRQASGLIKLPRGKHERDVLADALIEKYRVKK